jgi:hypothetical protein
MQHKILVIIIDLLLNRLFNKILSEEKTKKIKVTCDKLLKSKQNLDLEKDKSEEKKRKKKPEEPDQCS